MRTFICFISLAYKSVSRHEHNMFTRGVSAPAHMNERTVQADHPIRERFQQLLR